MTESNRIDPVYGYIDNKVKSLKGQITKLRNRVETLEISGLQEQITSIDSQVKQLGSILLELERDVAQLRVKHHLHWALWALEPLPQNSDVTNCVRFARESASSTLAQVRTSKNPHQIVSDWYSKCSVYFKNHGNFELFP